MKNIYNIDENRALIIFKTETFHKDSLIPYIEYEIFNPINKTKLDLNYCKNEQIIVNIPISINENDLYKYDSYSKYYTDECNPFISEYGTDILLIDI